MSANLMFVCCEVYLINIIYNCVNIWWDVHVEVAGLLWDDVKSSAVQTGKGNDQVGAAIGVHIFRQEGCRLFAVPRPEGDETRDDKRWYNRNCVSYRLS